MTLEQLEQFRERRRQAAIQQRKEDNKTILIVLLVSLTIWAAVVLSILI